jgi:hypothetical protein
MRQCPSCEQFTVTGYNCQQCGGLGRVPDLVMPVRVNYTDGSSIYGPAPNAIKNLPTNDELLKALHHVFTPSELQAQRESFLRSCGYPQKQIDDFFAGRGEASAVVLAERDALRARVAELEKDAARYAFLRQSNDDKWSVAYFDGGDWIDIFGEKLDAFIDAELAKEQK